MRRWSTYFKELAPTLVRRLAAWIRSDEFTIQSAELKTDQQKCGPSIREIVEKNRCKKNRFCILRTSGGWIY
jgi:hypothetical protein